MTELFTDFFSFSGMIAYFAGISTAALWHHLKYKMHRGKPINWLALGFVVALSAMVFSGMQTTALSAEVQDCQVQFNRTLKARAAITEENDRLSRDQRYWLSKSDEAVGDLIARATSPADPVIAEMDPNDPRRRAWERGLVSTYNLRTAKYRAEIQRIEVEQHNLQIERENHPLPEPTCGVPK